MFVYYRAQRKALRGCPKWSTVGGMQNELTNGKGVVERVRLRVMARLLVLGGRGKSLSMNLLCDAWAGQTVNGEPALQAYHVQALMRSASPKLRELAQLATMLGLPVELLVCADDWNDSAGAAPMSCIYDLEKHPPPPPVVAILNKAA